MQGMYQRCAGIDVHQRFLVVCLSSVEAGQRRKEIRTFPNETAEVLRLREWLVQQACTHVGMESTGVYWMPVYRRLEGLCELVVANAQHIKTVPGRKTDVQDADWIAERLAAWAFNPELRPQSGPARGTRSYPAPHQTGPGAGSPGQSCPTSVLEESGMKLANVLSDILGKSGRAILEAVCEGESDPDRLAGQRCAQCASLKGATRSCFDR